MDGQRESVGPVGWQENEVDDADTVGDEDEASDEDMFDDEVGVNVNVDVRKEFEAVDWPGILKSSCL